MFSYFTIVAPFALLSPSVSSGFLPRSPYNATPAPSAPALDETVKYGGIATYFYQMDAAGACGQVHNDSAIICAMDQRLFGTKGPASPLCGHKVNITNLNNNESLVVTVADDCPSCKNSHSIDLSVSVFKILNNDNLQIGEFPIKWHFVD